MSDERKIKALSDEQLEQATGGTGDLRGATIVNGPVKAYYDYPDTQGELDNFRGVILENGTRIIVDCESVFSMGIKWYEVETRDHSKRGYVDARHIRW